MAQNSPKNAIFFLLVMKNPKANSQRTFKIEVLDWGLFGVNSELIKDIFCDTM